jgi:hypothetical protein
VASVPATGVPTGTGGARAIAALRQTLLAVRAAEKGGYIRATSRMYEVWTFLRLAGAFAAVASSDRAWRELVNALHRRGFGGLPRGTVLTMPLGGDRTVTLRYEPIVRPYATKHLDDMFFRVATSSSAPLIPDVLVTIAMPGASRTFAIDAKYTRALRAETWSAVDRYFGIRSVSTRRAAVAEVWIVAPVPTLPDAAGPAGAPPPDGWRGGLLSLVPGSDMPHAFLPAGQMPQRFTASPAGSRGRRAPGAQDGAAVALRTFVTRLLET